MRLFETTTLRPSTCQRGANGDAATPSLTHIAAATNGCCLLSLRPPSLLLLPVSTVTIRIIYYVVSLSVFFISLFLHLACFFSSYVIDFLTILSHFVTPSFSRPLPLLLTYTCPQFHPLIFYLLSLFLCLLPVVCLLKEYSLACLLYSYFRSFIILVSRSSRVHRPVPHNYVELWRPCQAFGRGLTRVVRGVHAVVFLSCRARASLCLPYAFRVEPWIRLSFSYTYLLLMMMIVSWEKRPDEL